MTNAETLSLSASLGRSVASLTGLGHPHYTGCQPDTRVSMGESTAETVVVNVVPDEPEPPTETPAVVVVETTDSGASDGELDIAVTVGALTARVDALEQRLPEVEVAAEIAESTASTAIDIALQAENEAVVAEAVATEAVEEVAATPEPDQAPSGKHTFFKSWQELRHGGT